MQKKHMKRHFCVVFDNVFDRESIEREVEI